jgi:ATP phosphoribosyltransferase
MGFSTAGSTGFDWIQENDSDVVEGAHRSTAARRLLKSRWCALRAEAFGDQSVADLRRETRGDELVNTNAVRIRVEGGRSTSSFHGARTEV